MYYVVIKADKYIRKYHSRFSAVTHGPFIFIRSQHKDNKPLIEHEKFHVRQWWFTLGTAGIWYKFIRKYRQWSEVKAYKIQIEELVKQGKNRTSLLNVFSGHLSSKYKLNITYEKARKLLAE